MSKNTFVEGISLGGLTDKQEIKILICFLLEKLNRSVRKNDIISILQNYGLANYFEASQAFSDMIFNKNITSDDENKNYYKTTESGKMIVSELSGSLPASIREKAIKCANDYFLRLKREQENKVIIRKSPWGYNVVCKVSGGDFNMMELKLYAPDMHAATIIKDNFYKDPARVYSIITKLLSENNSEF